MRAERILYPVWGIFILHREKRKVLRIPARRGRNAEAFLIDPHTGLELSAAKSGREGGQSDV